MTITVVPHEVLAGKPGFKAYVNGNEVVWDAGMTPAEAIGNVLLSHACLENDGNERPAKDGAGLDGIKIIMEV